MSIRRERVKVEYKPCPYKVYSYTDYEHFYLGRFESLDEIEEWLKTIESCDSSGTYYYVKLGKDDYLCLTREDIVVKRVLQEEISEDVDFH